MTRFVVGQAVKTIRPSEEGVVSAVLGWGWVRVTTPAIEGGVKTETMTDDMVSPRPGDGLWTCEKCGLPLNEGDECPAGCTV